MNYKEICNNIANDNVIDYLSLDIDEHYVDVLNLIPLDKYTFKVITIEHDKYRFGDVYCDGEREILLSHGYFLVVTDVLHDGNSFEDWWVHPSLVSPEQFTSFINNNIKASEIC